MELYGIDVEIKNKPVLEDGFIPALCWNKAYLSQAREPFVVAITGGEERCMVYRTRLRNTKDSLEADRFYANRLVKTLLWLYGGYKVSITGSKSIFDYLKGEFSLSGSRGFEVEFMADTYGKPFTVEHLFAPPPQNEKTIFLSRHLNGHRIGLDIGASARKVAAISNGKTVYTEEVLWNPIEESDPSYHQRGIMDSLMAAAKKIPRIDAIGISSAGIFVNNQVAAASIFREVSQKSFEDKIKKIYVNAAKTMGCEQLMVVNDGDVTALAGAMSLDTNNILGISMNNSEAAGFIDEKGNLTGWINELAFIPVDFNPEAVEDEWSKDIGCGVNYFSQNSALRLARNAGIRLNDKASDIENLRTLLIKAEQGESKARLVFNTIGSFLGHTLAFYYSLYKFSCVVLLGRVMSGAGGDMIFNSAQKVLAEEYPEVASHIMVSLPDENQRHVAQSVAAASLPEC